MKRLLPVAVLFLLVWLVFEPPSGRPGSAGDAVSAGERALAQAYADRRNDVLVRALGTVEKILPDDEQGSRHQRFIVRLAGGQTVLIAHNIELAPRVAGLAAGDPLEFAGEYEWNPRGGGVHWTHDDPQGRHPGGWIAHAGRTYR